MAQMDVVLPPQEPSSDHDEDEPVAIEDNPSGGDGENDAREVNKPQDDPTSPKKKKHRRGKSKKRRWKPYYKMSWKEKREQEDRETRRATRVRAERFAHGQPVAPYNTTQFLMEDHNVQEPDFDHMATNGHRHHRESTSVESSDEFYSSPEDEEEFLQKEFSEVYENIHAERLNSMSKTELIQEYIQLEDRVDKLERKLKEIEANKSNEEGNDGEAPWDGDAESAEKIRIFQEEIQKLAEENNRLRLENKRLGQKNGTIFPEPPSPASVDGD